MPFPYNHCGVYYPEIRTRQCRFPTIIVEFIPRNQDTAMPFPYNHCGVYYPKSGHGNAVSLQSLWSLLPRNQDTAMPFPYNHCGVGTRQCRLLISAIISVQPELI
jgi:hypothetical protein